MNRCVLKISFELVDQILILGMTLGNRRENVLQEYFRLAVRAPKAHTDPPMHTKVAEQVAFC